MDKKIKIKIIFHGTRKPRKGSALFRRAAIIREINAIGRKNAK